MAQGDRFANQSQDNRAPLAPGVLSPDDYLTLLMHQKDRSLLGRLWNSPNTLLGLAYGGLGYAAGKALGTDPRILLRDGAVQFTNNPFGGVGALTLGDTTTWDDDPYDLNAPADSRWRDENGLPDGPKYDENGLPDGPKYRAHENAHRPQGDLLGPLYLPSNILGGLYGLLRDQDWHGPSNWNERGPLSDPPRPWAERS